MPVFFAIMELSSADRWMSMMLLTNTRMLVTRSLHLLAKTMVLDHHATGLPRDHGSW